MIEQVPLRGSSSQVVYSGHSLRLFLFPPFVSSLAFPMLWAILAVSSLSAMFGVGAVLQKAPTEYKNGGSSPRVEDVVQKVLGIDVAMFR